MNHRKRNFDKSRRFGEVGGLAGENKKLAIKDFSKLIKKQKRKSHLHYHDRNTTPLQIGKNHTKLLLNVKALEAEQQAKLKAETEAKKQEVERKAAAIMKRKQNRLEKFKQLSRKTNKGQPIMRHRMDILLKKIQKQVST